MYDSERAEQATHALIKIFQEIEDGLLEDIARTIRYDAAVDAHNVILWRVEMLQKQGMLSRESAKKIAQLAKVSEEEVIKAIERIGYDALVLDEALYQMAFAEGKLFTYPEAVTASPNVKRLLYHAMRRASDELNLVRTTMTEAARLAYIKTINKVYLEVLTGTRTYQEAVRRAYKELAEKGFTGATYTRRDGRTIHYQIDTAVRRAILTSARQVSGELQLERANAWGSDLVEVTSHLSARPEHALWQGQVYSLSGKHPKYKDFKSSTGYGSVTGLCGVNCRHSFYPYIEGLSNRMHKPYDLETNANVYADSQRQRKLERDVRQLKRAQVLAMKSGDTEALVQYKKQHQERSRQLLEFTRRSGRTRRYPREQVLEYNRQTAKEVNGRIRAYIEKLQWSRAESSQKAKIQGQIPWKKSKAVLEQSTSEHLLATNPKFYEARKYRINCQRCVPTYEMRKRGYNVTALPRPGDIDQEDYLSKNWPDAFLDGKIYRVPGVPSAAETVAAIKHITHEDSRFEVACFWRSGSGHVFVAEQNNGFVSFIDPQTGDADCSHYFPKIKDDAIFIMRIDDLIPSQLIFECCKEVKRWK